MNRNKIKRTLFTKEMNMVALLEKDRELDTLLKSGGKIITAKSGRRLLVDEDSALTGKSLSIKCRSGYVEVYFRGCTNGKKTEVSIGRYILKITEKNIKADHKNRNPLDNRRCNLRCSTQSDNLCNRIKHTKPNNNKYIGYTIKRGNIFVENQKDGIRYRYYLGKVTEEYAAVLYDCLVLKRHGEFAMTNFNKENYSDKMIIETIDKHSHLLKIEMRRFKLDKQQNETTD